MSISGLVFVPGCWMRCFCWVVLALGSMLMVAGGAAASDLPITTHKVLVLNSYHPHLKWTDRVVTGIAGTLDAADQRTDLYIEYMDTKRFDAEAQLAAFGDYLRRKYPNPDFDAIIASDDHAFDFVIRHRSTLFDRIPIVFCGVNYYASHMIDGVDNVTGVVESIDIKATLDVALSLHPDTERVLVINDRTATGRANRLLLDALRTHFDTRVRFDFIEDLAMAEVRRRVASLDHRTLVLLLSYTRDGNGDTFSYIDSIRAISEKCAVPMYGVWEFYLGRGIVGGMLTSGFLQGKTAAELTLKILNGTSADDIDVIEKSPNRWMFDAVQLKRFDIQQPALPAPSRIVNAPRHLFVEYQKWIWAGLVGLIVQMVVILALSRNIRMRRQAEEALQQQNLFLTTLHDTAVGLISQLSLDDLIEAIVARAADFAKTTHGYFYLYDASRDALVLKVGMGLYQDQIGYVVHRNMGVAGKVLESGEVIVINDYPHWADRHPDPVWDSIQSIAGIPLQSKSRFVGVIGLLHTHKGRRISGSDIEVLQRFGDLATLALNNAQLYRQLETELNERKQAQQALADSEEKFRKLFVASPIWMELVTLEEGRFIEANNAFFAITGYGRGEVIGRRSVDVGIWPEPSLRTEVVARMKQTNRLSAHPSRFRMKNGDIRDFLWSAEVIEINGQRCALSVILDVTEQKRIEAALKESENRLRQSQRLEAIGNLSGGIAHDFNNILTPIMIQADMGLVRLPPDSPVRTNLAKIRQAGERAKHLVKQVLAFSRPSKEEKRPFAVEPVIKEVLKLIRSSLPVTIDIRPHINTHDSFVLGDPTQLHQVLMNLCTNAGYAMRGQSGLLEIQLNSLTIDQNQTGQLGGIDPGTYIDLRVSDTGSGIPEDIIDRIFEPYFTTKDVSEGTGLGLAVVHGIVSAHGGTITVDSTPDQGTTFRVLLPRLVEASEPERCDPGPLAGGCEKILLVDDEPATVEVLQEILTEVGYEVTGHTDALSAYAALEARPDQFDLVITDQTMPGLTGIELSTKMWRLRPDLPVILCTGYSETVTREEVARLGIKALVMKPFDADEITRTIRTVLASAFGQIERKYQSA